MSGSGNVSSGDSAVATTDVVRAADWAGIGPVGCNGGSSGTIGRDVAGGPGDVDDLDDAPDDEVEAIEARLLDEATAARSIAELKAEIETVTKLENLALAVRQQGATPTCPRRVGPQ